ncbi:uncharacterized protein [Periplaneta americana]|uniref:uncharacterized protein n=1 Tax=Periplaneta americana TaxID=6978 RepID=UPI0037E70155
MLTFKRVLLLVISLAAWICLFDIMYLQIGSHQEDYQRSLLRRRRYSADINGTDEYWRCCDFDKEVNETNAQECRNFTYHILQEWSNYMMIGNASWTTNYTSTNFTDYDYEDNDYYDDSFIANASACYSECIFARAGAIGRYRNIDYKTALQYIKSLHLVDDAIIWERAEEKCRTVKPDPNRRYICDPLALSFEECVVDFIVLYCPVSKRHEGKMCDAIREDIRKTYEEY